MIRKTILLLPILLISISTIAQVGINTTDPEQTLDVNGTTRLRAHLFDYNNGNGIEGDILRRGEFGVEWSKQDNRIPSIIGNLSTVVNSDSNKRISWRTYTGASITLPPGRYQLNVTMLLTINDDVTANFGDVLAFDEGYWIKTTFTDSDTDPDPSADFEAGSLYSGGINGVQQFSTITGTLIVNNTSGADKTYYYWTYYDNGSSADAYGTGLDSKYLIGFASTLWRENQIIAQPIK